VLKLSKKIVIDKCSDCKYVKTTCEWTTAGEATFYMKKWVCSLNNKDIELSYTEYFFRPLKDGEVPKKTSECIPEWCELEDV
jgi:hypothetical protein